MRKFEALRELRGHSRTVNHEPYAADTRSLLPRLVNVFLHTWDLGWTSFGGPGVQFQIFRKRFVDGENGNVQWVDSKVYQELFSLCQGTPGPASTKLLICLTWIHAGCVPALFVFILWSLPTAIAMLALAIGIQHVNSLLPSIVYAFLSGLNAAIVGIIALAAVQLSEKAITDRLSRILIVLSGCAGVCYSSLWYFPVIIVAGGFATVIWDMCLAREIERIQAKRKDKRMEEGPTKPPHTSGDRTDTAPEAARYNTTSTPQTEKSDESAGMQGKNSANIGDDAISPSPINIGENGLTDTQSHSIPVPIGLTMIASFIAIFVAVVVASRTLDHPPRALSLFANMLLSGTIIFGGGPVLIPLLREYVVQPGWVSSRDFLIGLAIIQTMPGPNFNFAVYVGFLAMLGTDVSPVLGGWLGFVGIFLPGLAVGLGFMSIWRVLRKQALVISALRGLNYTAIGLIFTAVYRIWQIGFLSTEHPGGESLNQEPWWLVVTVTTYTEVAWFKIPIPIAIVAGGLLGLCWFGVTGSR